MMDRSQVQNRVSWRSNVLYFVSTTTIIITIIIKIIIKCNQNLTRMRSETWSTRRRVIYTNLNSLQPELISLIQLLRVLSLTYSLAEASRLIYPLDATDRWLSWTGLTCNCKELFMKESFTCTDCYH